MSPKVMSQQLTASESKERGELYSDGRPDSICAWGCAGSSQSAVHFHHACVTRPNRSELWATADMRNRSASTVDQIDERLVSFRVLNGAVDRNLHDSWFLRRPRITCDSPQELSEPVNHFSRYIRCVHSRRRSFSQKGSGFVVCAQQLNGRVVINRPSNRNVLQGSNVFLLRIQAAS